MNRRAFQGLVLVLAAACARKGPRDVGNQNPSSEFGAGGTSVLAAASVKPADPAGAPPGQTPLAPFRPREIARASARALAVTPAHVLYGDAEDDALYAASRRTDGGTPAPSRLARRAPMPNALALEGQHVVWIGSPGDVVFRAPLAGGTPVVLREKGIFTDVAVHGGDVFLTEAQGTGGSVIRVTGTTAARLAQVEGSPRGIAVDRDRVYVATTRALVATTRQRGDAVVIAKGQGFACPLVDDAWLYAIDANPDAGDRPRRRVVRVKKSGGNLEPIARGVAETAIALHHGSLYWIDAERHALVRWSTSEAPGTARVLTEDASLAVVTAIAVDDEEIVLATGDGQDARIVAVSASR